MRTLAAGGRAHIQHAHAATVFGATGSSRKNIPRKLRTGLLNVIRPAVEIGIKRKGRTLIQTTSQRAPLHNAPRRRRRAMLGGVPTHRRRGLALQRRAQGVGLRRAQLAPHALHELFGQRHHLAAVLSYRARRSQMLSKTDASCTKSSTSLSTINTSPLYMLPIQYSYFSFRRRR